MKNSNKKRGFTIVELIIVIAVIAILAAVLIPTFSSLINKSLVAADESLVRNLNEALAMDVTNPHNTMTDALKATKENGFDVSKINARASTDGQKHEILWDSRNDCFVYKKGNDINYIPKSNTKGDATPVELWHIANDGKLSENYSNYLAAGTYAATLNITTGLDVGEHTEITEVNYSNTNKQKAVIRMNGGKLSVNAPSDDVYFYGYAQEANITEVAGSSFHVVDGIISYAEIAKGHFVVENDSIVNVLYTTAQTAKIDKQGNSIIGKALTTVDAAKELKHGGNVSLTLDANGANKATNKENSVFRGDGTEESPYLISCANEMILFRNLINTTATNSENLKKCAKLTKDIDLSLETNWSPIGMSNQPYQGVFDGDNHVISNLTVNRKSEGQGLFGYIQNATIKNLKMNNANISATKKSGIIAGFSYGDITATNITIDNKSSISGSDNIGGLFGVVYVDDNSKKVVEKYEYSFTNLVNNASVSASDTTGRAGGIIGSIQNFDKAIKNSVGNENYVGTAFVVNFTNCENNGSVYGKLSAGMVSSLHSDMSVHRKNANVSMNNAKVVFTNCKNTSAGVNAEVVGKFYESSFLEINNFVASDRKTITELNNKTIYLYSSSSYCEVKIESKLYFSYKNGGSYTEAISFSYDNYMGLKNNSKAVNGTFYKRMDDCFLNNDGFTTELLLDGNNNKLENNKFYVVELKK